MDEENPLHYAPQKTCSNFNRRGRPKNENLIKFSPQPRSRISQMLKNITDEKVDSIISECLISNNRSGQTLGQTDKDVEDNGDTTSIMEYEDHLNESLEKNQDPSTTKNLLYPCDYPKCKYISKLSSNLIKHKRTHTMEKPYLCDLCSFRSNFVNSLKVHRRTHTNERPYGCNHCSYRCNSSSNLKKHSKHRHWDII